MQGITIRRVAGAGLLALALVAGAQAQGSGREPGREGRGRGRPDVRPGPRRDRPIIAMNGFALRDGQWEVAHLAVVGRRRRRDDPQPGSATPSPPVTTNVPPDRPDEAPELHGRFVLGAEIFRLADVQLEFEASDETDPAGNRRPERRRGRVVGLTATLLGAPAIEPQPMPANQGGSDPAIAPDPSIPPPMPQRVGKLKLAVVDKPRGMEVAHPVEGSAELEGGSWQVLGYGHGRWGRRFKRPGPDPLPVPGPMPTPRPLPSEPPPGADTTGDSF